MAQPPGFAWGWDRQAQVQDPSAGQTVSVRETAAVEVQQPGQLDPNQMQTSPDPRWRKRQQAPGVDVLGADLTQSSDGGDSLSGFVRLDMQPAMAL